MADHPGFGPENRTLKPETTEPMSMTFDTDRDLNLTVFRLAGPVSFETFKDVIDRYRAAGPTQNEIYDFLAFSGETFTMEQLNQLVEITKSHAPPRPNGSKTALVVPDTLSFGVSRQYQTLANMHDLPWETEVFETIAAARRWISLPN